MNVQTDKQFIELCLNTYFSKRHRVQMKLPVKIDPQDGGVPASMVNGEVDEEGYVAWKMLPSTVTEEEITEIEQGLPARLPPLFRAYLTTQFVLDMQIINPPYFFMLPELPADNPFQDIAFTLQAWNLLLITGYIPFAEYQDGWGPVCFDTKQQTVDGDYAIVWFDHEHLLHELDEGDYVSREKVESYAQTLFPSFRVFMTELFLR
ncbi:SMI1/KNR4 family protein [Aneurinibacillus aneurinilyticus]|uniref:SMI1/KNR4 family protein n=1 Tax=Aneurinibacillus aneurinilyticus TaxID=1391 RepID=UPI0023F985ED|nr:SMI1/KNR4 family protein [Aneurinibacillus aneurinilyticus]MCI1695686.1 SMI1/KNR4 family protein [Aneurinibacillus aneurinilyticus]